ncbi:hypothetical protein PIB30_010917 [Stylosanthes scabra]|uniref:Plastocyanin-like domain-containing protein n=1 Tax=Stylosanthes scabra TaxID=79078 RepID=A0ABU6T5H8_9FABA|nr:hypothetical protein [Stylosanthes scabra]
MGEKIRNCPMPAFCYVVIGQLKSRGVESASDYRVRNIKILAEISPQIDGDFTGIRISDGGALLFLLNFSYMKEGMRTSVGGILLVILINSQFPGPRLDLVTNDNLVLNLINKLDEPFLITWNDIKQRKNLWQDGVLGTKCTIPPNSNYTYKFQTQDQIGTFSYFPSAAFVKLVNFFSITFALKIAVLGLG